MADMREFYRAVRTSLGAAAILLTFDVAFFGWTVLSTVFCPIWILISLLKNSIQRPGWRIALVRIGLPGLIFWLVRVNNDFQIAVAKENAQRVVAACEGYHADNGRFPKNLDELVPQYLNSVPVAKYCLGPSSRFTYTSSGAPKLWWEVVPPHYRKIYNFETRSWSYLD
jgi:hypothetical protein